MVDDAAEREVRNRRRAFSGAEVRASTPDDGINGWRAVPLPTRPASRNVAEAVATMREGDPRFLATALQALREKRELLTLIGGPAEGTPVHLPARVEREHGYDCQTDRFPIRRYS